MFPRYEEGARRRPHPQTKPTSRPATWSPSTTSATARTPTCGCWASSSSAWPGWPGGCCASSPGSRSSPSPSPCWATPTGSSASSAPPSPAPSCSPGCCRGGSSTGTRSREFVTWRVWSNWRAWRTYGRHWDSVMVMTGLGDRYLGEDYVPVLVHARCRRDVDKLTVQLLQGQHPDEFAAQADTLAHTFGMLACRSRIAGPGVVTLEFLRVDRLAEPVAAIEPRRAARPAGTADRRARGRPAPDGAGSRRATSSRPGRPAPGRARCSGR